MSSRRVRKFKLALYSWSSWVKPPSHGVAITAIRQRTPLDIQVAAHGLHICDRGDVSDDACQTAGAIQRTLWPLQEFDALQIGRIELGHELCADENGCVGGTY